MSFRQGFVFIVCVILKHTEVYNTRTELTILGLTITLIHTLAVLIEYMQY